MEKGVEAQQPEVGVGNGQRQQAFQRNKDVVCGVGVVELVDCGQHVLHKCRRKEKRERERESARGEKGREGESEDHEREKEVKRGMKT